MSAPAPPPRPDPQVSWPGRKRRGDGDRLAAAESARIDADTARREAQLERERAEAARRREEAHRVAAESTAHRALRERDEALARVSELEAELADPDAEGATAEVEQPGAEQPAAATAPIEHAPAARGEPVAPGGPDVSFAPRSAHPAATVLLSVAALCAAGVAVYLAYLDRLASTPGVVTAAVTLALVFAISRAGTTTTVEIRRGVVHLEGHDATVRFDLTSAATLVQMVGQPAEPGWKVVFLRKTRPPVSVDSSMVEPHAFVSALRGWRPDL
jgi:hypothetical protein